MNTQNSTNKDILIATACEATRIDGMRLQILLQQGGIAIVANLIIICMTGVILYPAVNQSLLVWWWVISVVVNVSRLALWQRVNKTISEAMTPIAIRRLETQYAVTSFVSGLIWGGLGGFFSADLPPTQQLTIPLVVGGLAAGAMFSYLSSQKSSCAFILPMLLPVSLCVFLAGLETIALIILVYLVAIVALARNLNARMLETMRLRYKNDSLVSHLSEVNEAQSELLAKLQEKENFLTHTFEDAGVPMWLIGKSGRIKDVNKAGCALFGYEKEALLGKYASDFLHPEDPSETSHQFEQLLDGKIPHYRITRRCLDQQGRTMWLNSTVSAVKGEKGEIAYVVVQAQDITEQYQLSENLQHQSLHDSLTGLPNRRALENRLYSLLNQSDAEKQSHVFCYLDLDQFKVINDTCGHIAGDSLLKQLSRLIRDHLRQDDMLARFSGDEFAILMIGYSLQQATVILNKLLEKIRAFSFEYDGYTFKITASIGLVMIDGCTSLVELLKQADSACHVAKDAGRDRLHVFSETDSHLVQRSDEMRWIARIQQALADNRLVLFSQPICAASKRADELPHCELLIRMLDSDGSIISPGKFLPAAERYNLAAAIDMWTVEHVLSRLSSAREAGRDIRGIYAINLSGQSLGDERFYERIIHLIVDARLNQDNAILCFEITETAAITNMRSALHFINELRKIGCLFALDDFGSGLSSFAYLKQLPIDYLKIDGMFVRDCVKNTVNLEIVNAINGIGQVLGLKTVAEFVEDEATLISMQHLGINFVQGYQIAAPSPWEV